MTTAPLLLDSRAERRESNFELLRIIAMSMVLVNHFFFHGGPVKALEYYHIHYSFTAYGVDLFILISGWFGIRTTWSSLIRLWLYTLFFTVAIIAGYHFACACGYNLPPLLFSYDTLFAPFSNSNLWFLGTYFALMIVAPLLNRAVDGMSLHNLRIGVVALTFVEFYSCFFFGNLIDRYGFGFFNFIYLYTLGRYLSREPLISKISLKALIIGIIVAIGLFIAFEILCYKTPGLHPILEFVHKLNIYSSPKIVTISVAILLVFSKWHFHSKIVNSIASAAFGCYILQDGIASRVGYDLLISLFHSQPLHAWHTRWGVVCVAIFTGTWGASYILTGISRMFIPKISSAIERILPSWLKPE